MCINTSVTSCTSKILVFSVRNMLMSLRVSVFLGETKIDQVNNISFLSNTDKEVIWLNISVNVVS